MVKSASDWPDPRRAMLTRRTRRYPQASPPRHERGGKALIVLTLAMVLLPFWRPQVAHAIGTLERAGEVQEPAAVAFRSGRIAVQEGRLAEADEWLRLAWWDRRWRDAAAQAMHQLHSLPGYRVPVDHAAVARAERAAGVRLNRIETANVVLLSDADIGWTRDSAELIEQARAEFYRFCETIGFPAYPHRSKLVCVLFKDYSTFRHFASNEDDIQSDWVAGYYSIPHNRVVLYDERSGPGFAEAFADLEEHDRTVAHHLRRAGTHLPASHQAERLEILRAADSARRGITRQRASLKQQAREFGVAKTIHEAIHQISFNSGLQQPGKSYPLWLSEGLAIAFETDRPTRSFGPGKPGSKRLEHFREARERGELVPLERLLVLERVPHDLAADVDLVYAQCHALFELLYKNRRRELADYFRALNDGRGDESPQEIIRIFERHFGELRHVERALERF